MARLASSPSPQAFWIKEALTFTPAELASIAVWLTLPWTIKMVFGQLADSVPIFGSQRRAYVYIGASLVATGLVILAGAAGGWITFAGKNALYVSAQLLIVIGVVLQDVVADAMTTEVVDRKRPDGTPRPLHEVERELGLVQVLGRLALWSGILSVAGLSGWLAQIFSYETVFLLGLDRAGDLRHRRHPRSPRRREPAADRLAHPRRWARCSAPPSLAIGLGGLPFGQELIFLISVTIIGLMLARVAQDVDEQHRKKILFAALVIFFYRATPGVGEGYRWFTIDVLGFDEGFYGTLAQIGAGLSLAGAWLFSDVITRQPIAKVLLWLTILGTILTLPSLALALRWDEWTEADVRLRRSHHRLRRHHRFLALCRAQHDPGLDAGRSQRPAWPPRHLVCADGLADERCAGCRATTDQVSQSLVRRRSRHLRESACSRRRGAADRLRRAGCRRACFRQARHVTFSK